MSEVESHTLEEATEGTEITIPLDAVFNMFKSYIDSRLVQFSSQKVVSPFIESKEAVRDTKRLRGDTTTSKLEKKGHNNQFLFNAEVLDEVKSISSQKAFY